MGRAPVSGRMPVLLRSVDPTAIMDGEASYTPLSPYWTRHPIKETEMSLPAPQRLSEEEYLRIEQDAQRKNEFFDGQMFAMAGGSPAHNLIVGNVIGVL